MLKPSRGAQLNRTHPLARGLVGAWLLNEGNGGYLNDLTRNISNATNVNKEWASSVGGIGVDINSAGDEIDLGSAINVDAGSNFTDFIMLHPISYTGSNPGLWRGGASSAGTTFGIVQGANSLPWIRLNGADVLKPSSGTTYPSDGVIKVSHVVRHVTDATWFLDGKKEHYATHAANVPSFTVNNLGWQSATIERVDGVWLAYYFWNRALSDDEIFQLHANPYQLVESYINPALFYVEAVGGITYPIFNTNIHSAVFGGQVMR